MTLWSHVVLVAVGLGLLTGGGELLVKGAVALALRLKVRPAVIGLTVVAVGTSLPELVVSVKASIAGSPDLAVANVVGSNIFNILAVLGVAALLRPLVILGTTVRLEWPVMVLAAVATWVFGRDGLVDRGEGAFLLLSLTVFIAWTVRLARHVATPEEKAGWREEVVPEPADPVASRGWVAGGWIVAGVVLLVAGGNALVSGAVFLAEHLGFSQRVIGLTVVAAGTSLPELATSAMASWRGHDDVAIGNVVGSNIFNVLGILGLTAVVHPVIVDASIAGSDVWWMIGCSVALLPLMWPGLRMQRWKGALLLLAMAAYLYGLALAS